MEKFEERARAQCRVDLLAVGLDGAELDRMVDMYWPAVAVELAGGVDVPEVRFPLAIAQLVADYETLRGHPGVPSSS